MFPKQVAEVYFYNIFDHFKPDHLCSTNCFMNLSWCNTGFAKRLLLKRRGVSGILDRTANRRKVLVLLFKVRSGCFLKAQHSKKTTKLNHESVYFIQALAYSH